VAKRYPDELVRYMKTNGRKKVMFGTNYPMITAETCLKSLDTLALDKEVESNFLYENVKRVFDIE
jgi:predicted TIM-barrel fold metal-dependent hydrolase